jgi:hypothetical protein
MNCLRIAAITLAMVGHSLLAGPPMICHPYVTENEVSIPWSPEKQNWSGIDPKYDTASLPSETIRLLDSGLPMFTRMETLRRAAVYTARNSAAGLDLMSRLLARALEAEVKGQPNSQALFDAGFFVETMKQLGQASKTNVYITVDGYEWAKRSLPGLQDKLAAEYALGLMQAYASWPNEHIRRAAAGAQEGSALARNLTARFERQSLTEVKKTLLAKSAAR